MKQIHQSSYIDLGAQIGEGTKIWHFCHVMGKAVIGENCNIGQNVFVANNVIIGDNCKIQNNVSLYEGLIIEDDVFIGPSVVFTNIKNPRAFINRKGEYMKTCVETGVTIGANATIICGITIGKYALIGAGSVVTKDVLPYSLVIGNPGRVVKGVTKELYRE
jgi:UDP-2-acetamido-3-amino-2,3-dideoxy-glucuronate N-acetyltransferase